MAFRQRGIHWSLGLGQSAFGLITAGVYIIGKLLFGGHQDSLRDKLEQLPSLSRADVLAASSGKDVVIEGQISPTNEVMGYGMVAYTSQHSVLDSRNDQIWVPGESVTPVLIIDMADGPITLGGNYFLAGDLPTITEGTNRYQGVSVGDQVVVIGRPAYDKTIEQLYPSTIIRGTRASYLQPRLNLGWLVFGLVLIATGVGIMAVLLRRGYSPFGNPNTGR